MKVFGERVKKELKESGKTQKELARAINVQTSTLCEWLNDHNEPPMQAIADIAVWLGGFHRLFVWIKRLRLIKTDCFKTVRFYMEEQSLFCHSDRREESKKEIFNKTGIPGMR